MAYNIHTTTTNATTRTTTSTTTTNTAATAMTITNVDTAADSKPTSRQLSMAYKTTYNYYNYN